MDSQFDIDLDLEDSECWSSGELSECSGSEQGCSESEDEEDRGSLDDFIVDEEEEEDPDGEWGDDFYDDDMFDEEDIDSADGYGITECDF